jgi:hypothetical protein
MSHSQTYLYLRSDLRTLCLWIAGSAVLANFLPPAALFRRHRRFCALYVHFVDVVALVGANWRARLPSLEREFWGFRRRVRHGIRNWRQDRTDAAELK